MEIEDNKRREAAKFISELKSCEAFREAYSEQLLRERYPEFFKKREAKSSNRAQQVDRETVADIPAAAVADGETKVDAAEAELKKSVNRKSSVLLREIERSMAHKWSSSGTHLCCLEDN